MSTMIIQVFCASSAIKNEKAESAPIKPPQTHIFWWWNVSTRQAKKRNAETADCTDHQGDIPEELFVHAQVIARNSHQDDG